MTLSNNKVGDTLKGADFIVRKARSFMTGQALTMCITP